MTDERFTDAISSWLNEEAAHRVPGHLGELLVQTAATRQRPWWSSPERWLPVQLTYSARTAPANRLVWTIAILAMAILIAAAFVLAVAGQRKLPHFGSEANGSIAFVDGSTLKLAAADGSNIKVVAELPAGAESITFSPDGTRLAYRTTGTPASLIVSNPDGSQPVVVSGGLAVAEAAQIATGGSFAWSPDSRRLVFTRIVTADRRDIDIVDADGSHLATMVVDPAAPTVDRFDPAWSPDGEWIAYFTKDSAGAGAINVIHPDGTDARRLETSSVNLDYVEASWAPDPAVHRLEYAAGEDVKIFDLATTRETRVATGFWGSWSPDGRSIAWWDAEPGNLGSATAGGIRVAKVEDVLAGSQAQVVVFPDVDNLTCYSRVSASGICSPAEWSPDSQWVFGPDPTGSSIIFSTVGASPTVRTIRLDQLADLSNGPQGHLAWQPIAP